MIKEGQYLENSYSYLISKWRNSVLKLQNLATYKTYHMSLAMGLNILVVCWNFKISSKVLKNIKRNITLENSHSLSVITQYHCTNLKCCIRYKDQKHLSVDGLVVTHGLEASLQTLMSTHNLRFTQHGSFKIGFFFPIYEIIKKSHKITMGHWIVTGNTISYLPIFDCKYDWIQRSISYFFYQQ